MVTFILPLKLKHKTQTISSATSAEEQLVIGLKAGNKKSIEQLYNGYSSALYGIITRIVKFDEIAEDVLQDTFVKIWKNIDQYDATKGRLFTWMVNLAKNLAIDQVRSRQYVNANKTDDLQDVTTEVVDLKNHIGLNTDLIGLKQLTRNLKPDHKTIIDLFYFEGLTHVEVAEKLDIPLGTVKTRIRQAILHLRQYFNEFDRRFPTSA